MNGQLSIKTGSKDPTNHQEARSLPIGRLAAAVIFISLNLCCSNSDTVITYYSNGKVKEKIQYLSQDKRKYKKETYIETGFLKDVTYYYDTLLDGERKFYFQEDGGGFGTTQYRMGIEVGPFICKYNTGNWAAYSKFTKEGYMISSAEYYPNGKPVGISFYSDPKNGVGTETLYHKNGKIRYTGFYKHRMNDSIWIEYDTTETKIAEYIYKENEIITKKEFK